MKVRIKKVDKELPTPTYAHPGDAGCDLYSSEEHTILPGERALIPTGIAISLPAEYAAFIQPRSGLAVKHGISIVNTPGLIDSHYRGEIKVILINNDPGNSFKVSRGDKIAQMVIQKVESAHFEEVEELDETARGENGFGSTGVSLKASSDGKSVAKQASIS